MKHVCLLLVIFPIFLLLFVVTSCTAPSTVPSPPEKLSPAIEEPQPETEKRDTERPTQSGFLGQKLSILENSNGKIVALDPLQIDTVEAYRMRYLSGDLEVVGFILKPEGNDDKYPVLIYNRGGNREDGKIDEQVLGFLNSFVSRGFVVLASQYRGNDGGEGKEEFGGSDINDVLNLIPLAESLPFTLSNEIVMYGASRGGMMTYIALTKTSKIKAAVIYSGIVDCIQTYNEREQAMKQVLIDLIGGDPILKEQEYKLRSANYWPEKINTPVLILHGDADERVNVTQAKKLASKFEALGKTYELVVYPGGDHSLREYSADTYYRSLKWFSKYLQSFQAKNIWLGIFGETIDIEISEALKLPLETGVCIIEVTADSPADKAGLIPAGRNNQGQIITGGDIISGIDNIEISSMSDLIGYLDNKDDGDIVTLSIYRKTQEITIPVKLIEYPLLNSQ